MWKYSVDKRYCILCEYAIKKSGSNYYKDLRLYYCTKLPCAADFNNEFEPYTRVLGHGSAPDSSVYTWRCPKCPVWYTLPASS